MQIKTILISEMAKDGPLPKRKDQLINEKNRELIWPWSAGGRKTYSVALEWCSDVLERTASNLEYP